MDKIQQDIAKIRKEYYDKNSKNSFFTSSQKKDIAAEVCKNYDINILLENALIINGNSISIQYNILKHFVHNDNYDYCLDIMLSKFRNIIEIYGDFVCVVDLDTFTISAAERHKKLIEMFCSKCLNDKEYNYSKKLSQLNVMNAPNIMDTLYRIFGAFIDPEVKNKICIMGKKSTQCVTI